MVNKQKKATEFDAIIVGSGPNGLAAAISLALEGLKVKVFEASGTVGGGMRTGELIRSGYLHDICSAIHPMAVSSPFMNRLPLDKYGLEWIHPVHPAAHPLDDEPAAILYNDIHETAFHLDDDEKMYLKSVENIAEKWGLLSSDILAPLRFPSNPADMMKFGLKALQPASLFSKRFNTERAKALFAGMVAHTILPFDKLATAAVGLVFFATAHNKGWPIPKGGSQSIADAMARYLETLGGEIETSAEIKKLSDLPSSSAVLFDLTPRQVLRIVGDDFPLKYRRKLTRFQYGSGVFKVDYILKEPVPWKDHECRRAGTVHVGGTFEQIAASEKKVYDGEHPDDPFVLVAQQSLFDESRTPDEKQTLWAYCHVPNGSKSDMTEKIENQIERFAPGFKDVIDERITMNTIDFQAYNANYIGGDINGGRQNLSQLFCRPTGIYRPYATPAKGIYFCSSSTPPGGGVHGMCGYHAAQLALKNEFGFKKSDLQFNL